MSAFSKPLSVNPERPVDPSTRDLLDLIDQLLREARISYMLVGATARDLILYHVFGERITRATNDLDFAVAVDSWESFSRVEALLLESTGFGKDPRQAQRFTYRSENSPFAMVIDIVPFGRLESGTGTIAWPPNGDMEMNVIAFSSVFESSIRLNLDDTLSIPVTSLAGLMILKLFAWLDRRDTRDVQDIRKLLGTYTDAGNFERLYEEEAKQLEHDKFNLEISGAYLLGKDVRCIIDARTLQALRTKMTNDALGTLALEIARTRSVFEDPGEWADIVLSRFFSGLEA